MKKWQIAGLVIAVVLIAGIVIAEQMTFSTYYPAPYGVYNEMRARRMTVGGNYLDSVANPVADDNLIVEGRVGIGTTSPERPLHIAGKATDTGPPAIIIEEYFSTYTGHPAPDIFFRSARGTPTAPVDIQIDDALGGIHFLGYRAGEFRSSGNISVKVEDLGSDTVRSGIVFTTVNSSGSWRERVRINRDGNVGIGTNDPKGRLDVNGTIVQRGILPELHPDYVFKPDYQLQSIEEHAEFMWENKRLPAILHPERTKNGKYSIELGTQQRGLLEELEKAHIYIELLNERMKSLEAKLAK